MFDLVPLKTPGLFRFDSIKWQLLAFFRSVGVVRASFLRAMSFVCYMLGRCEPLGAGYFLREECIACSTEKCASMFNPVDGSGTPELLSNMLYAGMFLRDASGSGIDSETVY